MVNHSMLLYFLRKVHVWPLIAEIYKFSPSKTARRSKLVEQWEIIKHKILIKRW